MPKLHFSARSRRDLAEIWDYIATDSVRQADAVHERIYLRCEKLIDQPRIGHPRDDVARGLRCLNTDGYMILYRIKPTFVAITRIVHHSRNLAALDEFEPSP